MWVVYSGAIASTEVWEVWNVFQKLALLAQNNFAAAFWPSTAWPSTLSGRRSGRGKTTRDAERTVNTPRMSEANRRGPSSEARSEKGAQACASGRGKTRDGGEGLPKAGAFGTEQNCRGFWPSTAWPSALMGIGIGRGLKVGREYGIICGVS